MPWSIWLAASSVWVGKVWSKHRLRWLQKCAFTCWCLISPLCFLRNSAIGCKWGKLAPFILFLFNLFIYFFKQEMFFKFLFALNGDRLSNWTYSTPMPKGEGDWDKSEDWVTTRTERSAVIGNFQQYYMSSWSIKRLLMIYDTNKFTRAHYRH